LGEQRLLPVDDPACDVLREILDEERIVVDDALDRFLEQLREAGHVDALPARVEIDRAVDGGGDELFAAAAPYPDSLLHAGHADTRKSERGPPGLRLGAGGGG